MPANQITSQELEELKRLYQQIDGLTQSQAEQEASRVNSLGTALQQLTRLRREYRELTSDISTSLSIFHQITQEISRQNLGLSESKKGYKGLTSIAEKLQQHQQGINKLSSSEIAKLENKIKDEKRRLTNAQGLLETNKRTTEAAKAANEAEQAALKARIDAANSQNQQDRLAEHSLRRKVAEHIKIEKTLVDINTAHENNKAIINDQDEGLKLLNETLEKTIKGVKAVEKMMGLSGAAVGSIETVLNKLGLEGLSKQLGINDAKKEMQSLAEQIQEDKERALELENEIAAGITDPAVLQAKQDELNALKAGNAGLSEAEAKRKILKEGIGSMKKSIVENLKDPFAIVGFLVKELLTALISADKATGDLAKGMNMSYDNASQLRQEMGRMAGLSLDNSVTTKGIQESYMAIGKSIGAQVDMNAANLVFMTQMREKAGLTNEEMVSMNYLAATTGKDVKVVTKEFLGGAQAMALQSGKALNVKQLMQETSKVSNAIKLSIKGGALGLGEAAAQAKLLGMNLTQADNIASSLLNFEDSINAELEAELLTGKNLNLEAARLAAINGEMGKLTEEIAKNIGTSADFTNMNRLQQEAIAKAVGMTRGELADTLVEQEALTKLGRDLSKEEQSAFNAAKEKYGVEEASKMLGEGQLDMMMEQQSVQERLNASVEKLREVFISIADPILQIISPLADILLPILSGIQATISLIGEGFTWVGEKIGALIPNLGKFGKALKWIAGLGIILAAYKTFAAISAFLASTIVGGIAAPIIGGLAAGAIISAGFGLLNGLSQPAGDMASPAKGSTMVSTKEGGLFKLSNNDDFAAAPGLLDSLNKPAEAYAINTSNGNGGNVMSNAEVIALMKESIATSREQVKATKEIANQSININMDGEKVGEKSAFGTNLKNQKSESKMQ